MLNNNPNPTSNSSKFCKQCGQPMYKKAKICPHCGAKQGGKLKYVLLVFVILFVIAGFGSCGSNSSDSELSSTEKNTTTENIEYSQITAQQMLDDLENNALNASNTYKNKYLEISGVLANVDSDGKYFTINPSPDSIIITGIQVYLQNDEQRNQLMTLGQDTPITVKGKCTSVGEVLGYSIDLEELIVQ